MVIVNHHRPIVTLDSLLASALDALIIETAQRLAATEHIGTGRDPDFRVPNSKRIETARCPQMERLHRRFVIVLGKALASRYARSRWGGAGVDVTAKRLLGRGQTAHTGTARQGFGGEHR
jgi:hypothetical protein